MRLSADAIAQLPLGPCVLIVDDAHRRDDVRVHLALLRQRPEMKLLLSTRPQGDRKSKAYLPSKGSPGVDVQRLMRDSASNRAATLELPTHLDFTVLVGSRNLARGVEAAKSVEGDARAVQLDVTDRVSIANAAHCIRSELGRLDVLVQNAAISNVRKTQLGLTLAESAKLGVASKVSIDEVRAIWETNVFGVLAVYQAMLPLLREAPAARIVNVSSGAGSMTRNLDPSNPHRTMFAPGYSGSKAAMNALTVAMAIELEGERRWRKGGRQRKTGGPKPMGFGTGGTTENVTSLANDSFNHAVIAV